MAMRILKREELAEKLKDWQGGRVSTEEIFQWADTLYPSDDVDYEDWEEEESVTNEVLAALELLDMNLVLPEDVPIYLKFLATPPGKYAVGLAEYQRQLGEIDFESRRKRLKNVFPYAAFLQNQQP